MGHLWQMWGLMVSEKMKKKQTVETVEGEIELGEPHWGKPNYTAFCLGVPRLSKRCRRRRRGHRREVFVRARRA